VTHITAATLVSFNVSSLPSRRQQQQQQQQQHQQQFHHLMLLRQSSATAQQKPEDIQIPIFRFTRRNVRFQRSILNKKI